MIPRPSTTIRTRKAGAAALVIALALLAPAGLAGGAGEAPDVKVPEGARVTVASSLVAGELDVLGTLVLALHPGERVEARRVHVGPEGAILGMDGAPGAAAQGRDATGASGEPGHDIILVAETLLVEKGGRIVAGSGGAGGDADGWGLVAGGAGGQGGTVRIEAPLVENDGIVWPGSGGAGGSATQVVDAVVIAGLQATTVGGRGGDTGRAILNGDTVPVVAKPQLPIPPLAVNPPLPDCGPNKPIGDAANPPTGGPGGPACMKSVGASGKSGSDCVGSSAGTGGDGGGAATSTSRGGAGGNGVALGASGGPGGDATSIARGGVGGAGGGCSNTPGTGATGAIGGDADADATGGPGGIGGSLGGWGGAGGCARAEAKGGTGGAGGNASTTPGGGGNGGHGNAITTGGTGGDGDYEGGRGGLGGCAESFGNGGRGGLGGNCTGVCAAPTGLGGNAGEPTKADSHGGDGGKGARGGNGGGSRSRVDPEGGNGGHPDSPGGRGGDYAILSLGGNGGQGVFDVLGNDPGLGGAAVNEIPAGTAQGGVGGDGNPSNNLGHGVALVNLAVDGENGVACGLSCIPQVPPLGAPVGPKNFCETSSDWSTHRYWTSGGSGIVWGSPLQDGNLLGDCNGDTVPGDFDGHLEFAIGGAYLAADNGGVYASGPWAGASWGSVACWGEVADHAPQTAITIVDTTMGGAVGMDIAADYARDTVPPSVDPQTNALTICGDHVIEPCDPMDPGAIDQVTCNANDGELTIFPATLGSVSNGGTPSFNPGQDGMYVIWVVASVSPANPGAPTTGSIFN